MIGPRFSVVVGSTVALLAVAVAAAWLLTPSGNGAGEPVRPATTKLTFGGPFTLIDHTGRPVTDQDYRGRVMLVFFGYTFCPDVCPTTLREVAEALDQLGPLADQVRPLFVTIDPARDTPAHLADYVGHFDRRIIGLTGSPEHIRQAAQAYHARFARVGDEADSYLMDHTAVLYVMGRDGEFITHFPHGVPGKRIAEYLRPRLAVGGAAPPTSAGER